MNTAVEKLIEAFGEGKSFRELAAAAKKARTVGLERLSGSAFSIVAAAALRKWGGVHVFACADRDSAAYLAGDLYNLLGLEDNPTVVKSGGTVQADGASEMTNGAVLFFPTAHKRSVQFGEPDPSGIVQRTGVLNSITNYELRITNEPNSAPNFLAVCTYPEAIAEKVVPQTQIAENTLTLKVGEQVAMSTVEDILIDWGFARVDFVYEPGQYSIRGGIFDIFSYSSPRPYRVDFFGDEIESIRIFDISSQLSAQKTAQVEILPNLGATKGGEISLAGYAEGARWWMDDLGHTLGTLDKISVSGKEFLRDIEDKQIFTRTNSVRRPAEQIITFATAPQPEFNKKFDMLAANIIENAEKGYETYILSENLAQIERLTGIFAQTRNNVVFNPLPLTLHEGFVDHELKICLYTDHQIFDRYHRYKIRGEIDRDQSLTVAELNELKTGDFVVHIDHGVGRFGGLVKQVENGREVDAIKLVYKDNDVLLVNVSNLHRIARYKSGDTDEAPKIYKLGSGIWQRMKAATKKAVKEIARELIALYAKRKASGGFAFSADTYLQTELEASFRYEDTPDQQSTTQAVKADMEQPRPMDRLVCGDVGFGKTEIAIRAAFKAVADSKQVAVLVPTTILSLQHYRTFSERLRDFPARIEFLNRSKTAAETREILRDLADGKIDILIGTHKILGKEVVFKDLGLLIIDEEQKFGVSSKEKLREMSVSVDTLTLTATPIPRTLQFSLMGSRDLSVITTPPPNRRPIVTESHVFNEELIKEAIEAEMSRGGQVYFVHNRVQDIVRIADKIKALVPRAKVVVLHGQMEPRQIEKTIMEFIYGEWDVLVATSIIENGIDIPGANTIIINGAHRFGLSDLHQLRGRVGRSDKKGYCYLLSPPDELLAGDSRRRLRAIEEFSDLGAGFNIAMQDLDIRGAGNLFGAEQSGFIADIGFETYQKILNEAVAELRAEGVGGNAHGDLFDIPGVFGSGAFGAGAGDTVVGTPEMRYIDDSHIEIDTEAGIPDDYVASSAEKLRLYRALDDMVSEDAMQKFAASLADRFGPVPPQTETLMDVVRLRWLAVALGFERVKVKNGLAIIGFPADENSPYYKSEIFSRVLQRISAKPDKFVLKQNGGRLALTIRGVSDIKTAIELFKEL